MVAALGEGEAEPPIDVGGAIQVVTRVDDHVIQRRHLANHVVHSQLKVGCGRSGNVDWARTDVA